LRLGLNRNRTLLYVTLERRIVAELEARSTIGIYRMGLLAFGLREKAIENSVQMAREMPAATRI
jgi:hypothetical protein